MAFTGLTGRKTTLRHRPLYLPSLPPSSLSFFLGASPRMFSAGSFEPSRADAAKRLRSHMVEIITPYFRFAAVREDSVTPFLGEGDTHYLCDACLSFFRSRRHLEEHLRNCANVFWIPGNEIYRSKSGSFCVFEIDGRKPQNAVYARRLGILTKFFLPEKVTLDDVHFFSFNCLYETDDRGFHFAGYFSKEWKNSQSCVNTLSCVMVLPPYRSRGYGSFLVELSYEIARRDGMTGTPERPLSRSGKALFRKAWKKEVLRAVVELDEEKTPVTVNSLCTKSGLIIEDVLVALHDLHAMYTVGKQGPLLVLDESTRSLAKRRRLCTDMLQWSPL